MLVTNETNMTDLARDTIAVLDGGDMCVWLAGSQRAMIIQRAATIVHRDRPDVTGMRSIKDGKHQTMWWPVGHDATTATIGWWG